MTNKAWNSLLSFFPDSQHRGGGRARNQAKTCLTSPRTQVLRRAQELYVSSSGQDGGDAELKFTCGIKKNFFLKNCMCLSRISPPTSPAEGKVTNISVAELPVCLFSLVL